MNAIAIALTVKKFYRDIFGEDINISDMSLAIELLGHVYPKNSLDSLGLSKTITNPNVVDSGTLDNDRNRAVWDQLSLDLSFNEVTYLLGLRK